MVQKILTIQHVSDITGLSKHTLRYYEKIGLLGVVGRDNSGYRVYEDKHLDCLFHLKRLRLAGMSIQQLKQYAQLYHEGDTSLEARYTLLEQHRYLIQEQLKMLSVSLNRTEDKLRLYQTSIFEQGQDSMISSHLLQIWTLGSGMRTALEPARKRFRKIKPSTVRADYPDMDWDLYELFFWIPFYSGRDDISAYLIEEIYPTANGQVIQSKYEQFVQTGYYEKTGQGLYRVTDKGVELMTNLHASSDKLHDALVSNITVDLPRMVELTKQLRDAYFENTSIACHRLLSDGLETGLRNVVLPENISPLLDLWYSLQDLAIIADLMKKHLKLWDQYHVAPYVWSTFYSIGGGDPSSVDDLFEAVWHISMLRTKDEYQFAVMEGVRQGWLQLNSDDKYELTDKGKEIYDQSKLLLWETISKPLTPLSDVAEELVTLFEQFCLELEDAIPEAV